MHASFIARWTAFLAFAERRLPALTRLKRPEPLPIALHRRRIYVVPTRFGMVYSAMLLVMLVGALNYNNNPALLLTCLLAAASYQSVFTGFRMLNRLQLRSLRVHPCHAEGALHLSLFFDAAGVDRPALHLRMENADMPDGQGVVEFSLPGDIETAVPTIIPAPSRGWQSIGRVRVWSEYPLGMFHIWSWLHPDTQALIYPRIEPNAPPLPESAGDADTVAMRRAGDEFSMLREYHPSDPRRLIAWKASARHDALLVKELERPQSREIVVSWDATAGVDYESRISRLAAWVERAEALRTPYTLSLPSLRIGPAIGPEHQQACLRALALLPAVAT